ncbi:hypothetical protein C8R45DRAFT_973277 [Mycena sanguinolenta]|nr:hypothetical protein C8R45DRAFT_973277 [Mycena sanguinolenta]
MLSLRAVRCLSPQILAFYRPPLICRSLATVVQPVAHTTDVHKNPCLDFYRTNVDLDPFSCKWEDFPFWSFFRVRPSWHDLSEIDFFVRKVWNIQGTIRPLAYLPICDPCIVFEADGQYYYLDTCSDYLDHFGGNFASDDEFLATFKGPQPLYGTSHPFPKDMRVMYATVWEEQEQRKKAAEIPRKR